MSDNKSETERMNELESELEAHEARKMLANFSEDGSPEEFEGLDDDVAIRLARTMAENATRVNARPGDELQGAVNGTVVGSGREAWEKRQNGGE